MGGTDETFAQEFAERLRNARAQLIQHMAERGLLEAQGWRVAETVRPAKGGMELILRPLHLKFDAPDDLFCVVWIAEHGSDQSSSCQS